MSIKKLSSILSITVLMFSSVLSAEDKIILRVGHFPNITHAQALVAHQLSRQGKGWFEQSWSRSPFGLEKSQEGLGLLHINTEKTRQR